MSKQIYIYIDNTHYNNDNNDRNTYTKQTLK